MAGHGIPRYVCDDWRRAAQGKAVDGLHHSVDAEAHSHGGLAAHWRGDDRSPRSAKRHSYMTSSLNWTSGGGGGVTLVSPIAGSSSRHGEDEWSMGLLPSHVETAAGF